MRGEQGRGVLLSQEGDAPRPEPRPGPPLKTSFLLACARRLSVEKPGEGAVRLGRPLVPSHPSSAATPTPRSAQRAPGPTTHLPAGPGWAEGGAGALLAPLKHCACLTAGRGGTGSGGRARPHLPLAVKGWRPGSGRAVLVRVSDPAGSQSAL